MNSNLFPAARFFWANISIPIVSWVLIHVAAFFGFFVAFAYPVWWIMRPQKIPCLLCRVKQKEDKCLFCKEKNRKGPLKLKSVILNSGLILLLSSLSFVLVYFESKAILAYFEESSPKTVNFVIPNTGQKKVGEVFPMEVKLDGVELPVNAIQADIKFDPQIVKVVEISTENSIANIFVQKDIDNQFGYARINGGLANPGYSGSSGLFATFYFQAVKSGAVEISFLPSSMVLLNDGSGTNVLKSLASSSYFIVPEERYSTNTEEETLIMVEDLDVLGTEDDSESQLIFFDQKEKTLTQVLGENSTKPSQNNILLKTLTNGLIEIDKFILKFWYSVFN